MLLCRKKYITAFLNTNFPKGIEQASTQEILEACGITCKKDSDGFLIISHYKAWYDIQYFTFFEESNFNIITFAELTNSIDLFDDDDLKKDSVVFETKEKLLQKIESIQNAHFNESQNVHCIRAGNELGFSLDELGINENKLFQEIKAIEKSANFNGSQLIGLGNLQSIGGNANFIGSQITSLENLQSIGGNAYFNGSQITSLGNLQSIGGNFGNWLPGSRSSQLTDLGKLQSIGGNASFGYFQITNLGNLHSIGGNADFNYSQVSDLGKLQSIGGDAIFTDSQITSLGNLQNIGGDCYIKNTMLKESDFESIIINGKLNTILGLIQYWD